MNLVSNETYLCPVCGEENEIEVDCSAGLKQRYVEDCSVCCRPAVLTVAVEVRSGIVSVEAEPER